MCYYTIEYVVPHCRVRMGICLGLDYMATFAQGNLHMTAALAFQRHSCDRAARRLPVLFL
jgi:hypothetical protein